jgi:hypothetical protein
MLARILVLVVVTGTMSGACLAQAENSAPGAGPTAETKPASSNSPAPSAKKVWTNDDVASAKGGVSVIGKRDGNSRIAPGQTADAATIQRIRKNLEKLGSQLADVDKKLKSYKEFQEGEPVSTAAREINKGTSRVPVDQQMVQLENQKKQLEAQIGELYDEARKKGIDPGQLR